ncbi:dihydrodipicolinate synthase family protein [Polynucleobacter paneuropaeus]|nr:dihydrodipicolinate synthase family protein [Polynucleobacter paneuropaeus]
MTFALHPSSLPAVLSPVLTPFTANGNVDHQRLLKHCQWLAANGVGHALFGTNSEANSMSVRQKMDALTKLIEGGLDPGHIMPGTGANAIDAAVNMTNHALAHHCAAVLMIPPFYYKDISDDGLFAYFSEVIQKVGNSALQLYFYNIPPVTKITLSLALLDRLVRAYPKTIVGMKDSSGDWSYTESVIKLLAPHSFRVYAGNEAFLLRTMKAGGAGCISATVNMNPKAIAKLAAHWEDADAAEQQVGLDRVRSVFDKHQMITGMKTALAFFSKDPDWLRVRPPLMQLSGDQQGQLMGELKAIHFDMPGL